jgi:hypothetical protein
MTASRRGHRVHGPMLRSIGPWVLLASVPGRRPDGMSRSGAAPMIHPTHFVLALGLWMVASLEVAAGTPNTLFIYTAAWSPRC